MLTDGGKITATTLSADGLAVCLSPEGVDTTKRFTIGVVNLTDRKYAQNNTGYVLVTVDPGLCLSMDFEPSSDGIVYTGGTEVHPVLGINQELTVTNSGHSGSALSAGNSAMVMNVPFSFAEGQTISLWVRGKAGNGYNVLFAKGAKNEGHFEVYARSCQLFFYAPEIGDLDMNFNINSLGSGWHNLIFVRRDGKLVTYADGKEVSSINCGGTISETTADFTIGALPDGSLIFAGAIDTVRIYDRLLTDDEISEVIDQEKAELSFTKGLIALQIGETVSSGLKVTENLDYELQLSGTSVTLSEDGVLTAIEIGDSVLYARSKDGKYVAAMVARVTEPVVGSDTESDTTPDTGALETETIPAPDTDTSENGGCKSAIGVSALTMILLCGACVLRKKD